MKLRIKQILSKKLASFLQFRCLFLANAVVLTLSAFVIPFVIISYVSDAKLVSFVSMGVLLILLLGVWLNYILLIKVSEEVKNRLQIAMKAVGFGIWDWNVKNNILIWDDFMYKVFGIDKEDFNGEYDTFERALLKEDAARVKEELQETFKKQQDYSSEFRIMRKNGEMRVIRAEAKCFYDKQGEIQRIVGANWDVTDEREKELKLIQASKMSSLGEMSAGIAHEINNPLAIIKGKMAQITRVIEINPQDTASILRHVQQVDQTVERIVRIIKGLRSFARDEESDPMQKLSVKNLLEETMSFCHNRFLNHQVKFKEAELNEDLYILGRSSQISQILLNLLNNSFDAVADQKEKWVQMSVVEKDQWIEFSVTDSGPGVPMEIRSRILQPFFTTKALGKGTGLGLSIASGIVKSHKGSLEIDTQSQHTCFIVKLPKFEMPKSKDFI